MNYHLLSLIKWVIGFGITILTLFFINPYQDYIIGISAMLIGIILIIWSIWYAIWYIVCTYKIIPTTQNYWLISYGFGFLLSLYSVFCLLIYILYDNIMIIFFVTILLFIAMIWLYHKNITNIEDIY